MALKKADYRVYMPPEYQAMVVAKAKSLGLEPKDWIANLVKREIDESVHAATLITQAAVRSGLVRLEAVAGGKRREGGQ